VRCVRGVCRGGYWSRGGWGRRGAVVLLMPLTFCSCFLIVEELRLRNWRFREIEQCLMLLGSVCDVYGSSVQVW
jgi:hypothetical protein